MRRITARNLPSSGQLLLLRGQKYHVAGYDESQKTLLYYQDYGHRDDPLAIPLRELRFLEGLMPLVWIPRTDKGRYVKFDVSFKWGPRRRSMTTMAVSVAQARQRILFRVGTDLCGVSAQYKMKVISVAKTALAQSAGQEYIPSEIFTVSLAD